MRWQDESWDAPLDAPVGFAMPPAGTLGDVIYRQPGLDTTADGPQPADYTPPEGSAPALESLVPAPEQPRDPTQPFQAGATEEPAPQWDPHQPMSVGGAVGEDDAWPDDTDGGHPNFPPPTGRPTAPAVRTPPHGPAYPPPVGRPTAAPGGGYPGSDSPATTPAWHPGQPEPGVTMPGVGHFARPAPSVASAPPNDPYEAMRQPYPQARPWQTDPSAPTPIYRPTPVPAGKPIQLDWWALALLAAAVLVSSLSWLLFVVALIVAGSRRIMRPLVSTAFSVCSTILVIVWLANWISMAAGNPLFGTDYSPLSVAARICAGVMICVMVGDYLYARNRGR